MFDMHCHLDQQPKFNIEADEKVCLISQNSSENPRYLSFAQSHEMACALFANPGNSYWDEVCQLVHNRNALAYKHLEFMSFSDCWLIAPLLNACHSSGLPLIIHLSRHDNFRYSSNDAERWLGFLRETWPDVQLIISHMGGENLSKVLQFIDSDPEILVDLSCLHETAGRAGLKSDAELLDKLLMKARMTQLLFGSDRTWPSVLTPHSNLVDAICERLPDTDVHAVLEKNATRALKNLNYRRKPT